MLRQVEEQCYGSCHWYTKLTHAARQRTQELTILPFHTVSIAFTTQFLYYSMSPHNLLSNTWH